MESLPPLSTDRDACLKFSDIPTNRGLPSRRDIGTNFGNIERDDLKKIKLKADYIGKLAYLNYHL